MSSYSNTACPIVTFAYDRLGRVLSAVTAVSSNFFEYAGLDLVGEVQNGAAITRTYDGFGRPAGFNLGSAYTAAYGYDTFGRFASVSSSVASVFSVANYSYVTGSGLVASMTNSAGFWWRRAYEQNRDLIADVENGFGGDTVSDFAYVNDADGRRERRVDSGSATNLFASNGRGEVTEAVMGTGTYAYGYDDIGNRVFSVLNTVTNTYAANNLNQYTAITGAAPSYPTYDADGNLKRSGDWHHAWDAENRLVRSEPYGIATNGAVMLEYGYNHRSLCVTKITKQLSGRGAGYPMDPSQPGSWDAVKTHTFVYDGWNLALETIAHTNGTVDRIEYVWGLDLSGTLQGAGGVGGLLFEKRNGQIYIPLYDANGNVTDYVDAYGTVRGHFEYDAFGNTVAMWGDLAHSFKFRFSTKYWDDETRSYYYGYRHYAPKLGCWLSKDPIGEKGGVNLYGFAGNDPVNRWDSLGLKIRSSKNVIDLWIEEIYEVEEIEYNWGKPAKDLLGLGDADIGLTFSCSCINKTSAGADMSCTLTMRPVIRFPKGVESTRAHELRHVAVFKNVYLSSFRALFLEYTTSGKCCNCDERSSEINNYGTELLQALSKWDLYMEYFSQPSGDKSEPYIDYGGSLGANYNILRKITNKGITPCK